MAILAAAAHKIAKGATVTFRAVKAIVIWLGRKVVYGIQHGLIPLLQKAWKLMRTGYGMGVTTIGLSLIGLKVADLKCMQGNRHRHARVLLQTLGILGLVTAGAMLTHGTAVLL